VTAGPGYGFVPLPPEARRVERKHAVLDRRVEGALWGRIELVLRTVQPVHVGSGHKYSRDGKVVQAGTLVNGRPGIPGASLKGVLRSRYEAITRSCVPLWSDRAKVKSRSREDIQRARLAEEVTGMSVLRACSRQSPLLCPACALFGRMSLRSRVTVLDLACIDQDEYEVTSMAERFGARLHHVGKRRVVPDQESRRGEIFEVHELYGRKFYWGLGPVVENAARHWVEVMLAGRMLRGELRIVNVMPVELGGLLAALGRLPAGTLALGGGKARGLGRVRCVELRCQLVDADGRAIQVDEAGWRAKFEQDDDRWPEGEAALVALTTLLKGDG
jgi:CRISPR/Cas system CSM-associated protein Csm3 (group 7 of RAMP superfamily)